MNQLNLSLRQFGLNPMEWNIQRLQGTQFLITHREYKDFEFEGQVEFRNQRPRWKFIRLWSL